MNTNREPSDSEKAALNKLQNGCEVKTITVIGAGAFGTALAEVAARNGNTVKLYARNNEVVDSVNTKHVNPHYISEYTLHPGVVAYNDLAEALKGADFVILAIPTQLVSQIKCSICKVFTSIPFK